MATRRSLSTAMQTKPDFDEETAAAFVLQKNSMTAQETREVDVLNADPAGETTSETKRKTFLAPVGLVPVTVRLQPHIAGALKRASLERELSGEAMHTQQEIVSRALEPWLKQEGFLG